MEHLGIMRLILQAISMESPSGTIPSWQLDKVEISLDLLTMVPLGIIRLILQAISMESPSGTIPSWQLGLVERSLNLLTMLHLGIMLLIKLQLKSKESPSVNKS